MISLLSKSTPGLATIHSIWADGCETKRPQMRAVGGAIASYPDRRGRRQRVFGGVVGRSMSRHPCSSCERGGDQKVRGAATTVVELFRRSAWLGVAHTIRGKEHRYSSGSHPNWIFAFYAKWVVLVYHWSYICFLLILSYVCLFEIQYHWILLPLNYAFYANSPFPCMEQHTCLVQLFLWSEFDCEKNLRIVAITCVGRWSGLRVHYL